MSTENRALLGAISSIVSCGGAGFAAISNSRPLTIVFGLMAIVTAIITAPVIAANERSKK